MESRLHEIQLRLKAANHSFGCGECFSKEEAWALVGDFLSHAADDIAWLIDENSSLSNENDRLKRAAKELHDQLATLQERTTCEVSRIFLSQLKGDT